MKEKMIEQIKILEQAQKEVMVQGRLDLIVEIAEMIFKCTVALEAYK